jgi:hypothetical protein
MHANVVIALGSEESLPGILARIHGAGLGHNAFVLKPRRSSIQRQLTRSGIPTAQMPARVEDAEAALVIHAAARAGLAADITRQHGASATWIVSPAGAWTLVDDDVAVETTDTSTPSVSPNRDAIPAPAQTASAPTASDETPGI